MRTPTRHPDHPALPALGYGERLAIWTMRRIAAGRGWAPAWGRLHHPGDDLTGMEPVACGFRPAAAAGRPAIGAPGDLGLTGDERHLLAALAAAQDDDEARLGDELATLVPEAPRRDTLAQAVRALAVELAVRGHFLPGQVGVVELRA